MSVSSGGAFVPIGRQQLFKRVVSLIVAYQPACMRGTRRGALCVEMPEVVRALLDACCAAVGVDPQAEIAALPSRAASDEEAAEACKSVIEVVLLLTAAGTLAIRCLCASLRQQLVRFARVAYNCEQPADPAAPLPELPANALAWIAERSEAFYEVLSIQFAEHLAAIDMFELPCGVYYGYDRATLIGDEDGQAHSDSGPSSATLPARDAAAMALLHKRLFMRYVATCEPDVPQPSADAPASILLAPTAGHRVWHSSAHRLLFLHVAGALKPHADWQRQVRCRFYGSSCEDRWQECGLGRP